MDELVQIMECNEKNAQTIIPIFLKIDPTHVRHQLESFARALARHGNHPKIQRWRDVLTKAANLSGWDSQVIRPEATLIKSIVSDIMGKLCYTSLSTFGDLVGMSSRFEQIDMILKTIPKEVRIIGLWGMGGIGKSILARAFFNHFFSQFEGHYMIENFRETCEKHGLNELLDKLVSGLLKDVSLNIGTPNLEIPFIRDRLRCMKVLIILDDVNDFQHIELLVGKRNCLGPGSIIVITSRDKQVLRSGVDKIYEVPGLDNHEALCLFAQHAFKQEHPKDDRCMKLSKRAINYAKGNPLALKILGCHVLGRSNEEQESALSKLEKTPNMDIQKVLQISYDRLDNEEKNIFLNIACFLKCESIDVVKSFHDSLGYYTNIGISNLVDKSLITICMGLVWMHDLLQEMGREIVREESIEEPGKRSRLWDYRDISHVLAKRTGTKAIKGINLDMHGLRSFSINPDAFERMYNLQFLKIKFDCFSNLDLPQGLGYLPDELRCLDWERYPLTYLPANFHMENLVKLIMPCSEVVRLWNGRQNLPHSNLQELMLANCNELQNLPSGLSLRTLNINGCSQIKKFPEVSMKIEHLYLGGTAIEVPSTVELNVGECKELKNLPNRISKLKHIQNWRLNFPSKKRENLHEVNHLVWLSTLHISGNNFQIIPISIKQLANLKLLYLANCKRLQSLPQLPMNIQLIYARNCISLEVVASSLTTTTMGAFIPIVKCIDFNFSNCFKLNQNATNSIVANAELKLLHWETTKSAEIKFMGGDIPDWFKYKSSGSSLTIKLPEDWCNSELFCLAFGVVLDFKDLHTYGKFINLTYNFSVRNNIGNYSSEKRLFGLGLVTKDAIQSNHVLLRYEKSFMINEWRTILKETNDAVVISIEFHVEEHCRNYCKVKRCGIHLLYMHETKDRCYTSRIDFNSPDGSTQFFFNPGCMEDDMEETMIGDDKSDEGSNDNYCNMDNLGEFSTPMKRKKLRK